MPEEDFDSESLATYLHLTPAQVEKMASRGKIPARRIGGQWRFSRSEVHLWFENRIGLSDSAELLKVEKVLHTHRVQLEADDLTISELLKPHCIWAPLQARTRNSVIDRICQGVADAGLLWEPQRMADALRARENLHPTALENGVALLHPRRPQPSIIGEPFLALGLTTTGLPFGGPRGCMTDIFFLIASVDEPGHLRTLARLSRILADGELLTALREADSPQNIWNAVCQAEETVGS